MRLVALLLASPPALATTSFDPSVFAATFDDQSPYVGDVDGLPLWDRIERLVDPDLAFFPAEEPLAALRWSDGSWVSPHASQLFGSAAPGTGTFLLHFAPGWSFPDRETPVLLVPGAGTMASGLYPVLARALASDGRAVFAISFPHPQQDNFQAAELVADAVRRIQELTGAAQVDLVAHSKGGIAAAIRLVHGPSVDWGGERGDAYEIHGTPWDGSVRKLVAVGVPWAGLDTPFRWTAAALLQAQDEAWTSASPWETYYPFTTSNLFVTDDLRAVDLWPDAGDPFPGEAQLLARWDGAHPLPGTRADLGAYALQQDWWTTYEGGLGFMSDARGIDDAIARAGDTIGTLRGLELPSGLGVAVLAGTFPFLPVHQDYRSPDPFGEDVADFLGQDASFYSDFYTAALADDFPDLVITAGDADGLASGALMAGEISGRSDGVVFADSALAIDDLLDGGAVLLDSLTVPLSHLDLVLASPLSAAALRAQFLGTPDEAAMLSLADRYEAADTVAWIISVLARGEEIPGDDDDTTPDGDDDSSAADDDSSPAGDDDSAGDDKLQNPDPETPFTGCACSQGRERQFPWWSVAGPVAAGASRRRRKGPRTQTAAPEPTSAPEPSLMVKTTADIEPPMEPTPLTDPPVAQPGVEVQEPPLPVPSDEATQGPGFDPEPPPPGGNPAPLADAVLGPWVDGLRHLRRYLEHGVARRPHGTPWHTSHRIELSMPAADLRVFGAEAGPALLIVAPEINGAQIADYGPGQSLVGAILGHGWARVGLVCWRSAHEGTRGLSIADSIDTIARCAEHLGAPVPVVGICQGGWEAAVLAATRPELVSALVLGAGPIDFHAGNSLMTTLARHTPASWYRALVAAGGGVMPGELLRLGFDSLRPLERFGVRWMELWNGLDDPAFLDRHDRLEAWYGARKDLPGTMYLEAVTELFHGNQLVEGRFELRGRRVDLRDIRCPVALVGGSKDHITPMAQVWALEPFLTGAHARFVLDAGHVGIFIGHGPLHRDWPRILAWVAEHIGPADVPRPTVPVGGSSPSLGAEGISAG